MKNVASGGGYTEPSQVVVERAAQKSNTKVVWQTCDIFDVRSVGEAISRAFREVNYHPTNWVASGVEL